MVHKKRTLFEKRMKVIIIVITFILLIFLAFIKLPEYNKVNITLDSNKTKDTIITNKNNMDIFSPVTKFKDIKKDFLQVHFDAVVVDTHNDFLYRVYDKGFDLGIRNKETQSSIPEFHEGGLNVQFFAIWIPMKEMKRSYQFVVNMANKLKYFEKEYSDKFEIAYTYDDIKRIVLEKKLCGLLAVEGGTVIGDDINNVASLFELGIRYISLTWNNSNKIAVSAADEFNKKKTGGLTEFGFQVIKKMDEVGMLIDVSHLGEKSFWDVIKTSANPVIASHSNCYSINSHYRNLTDEQITAIAKSGGVVMINFHGDFLNKNSKGKTNTLYDLYSTELDSLTELYYNDPVKLYIEKQKFLEGKKVEDGYSADVIIDHIDYVRKLAGIDYVGIGSDMDGGIAVPYDLYDVSCYPLLTQKLAERGYTEPEIRKILGLNFLRVFRQVCG